MIIMKKKIIQQMEKNPKITSEEIQGLARTFSYYVKFPESRWDEIKIAEEHLTSTDSYAEGLNGLLWSLLNTKEFLLNH